MNMEQRLEQDRAIDPILFYKPKDKWGWCSNFSKHHIVVPNPFTQTQMLYKSVEHRYQAMKATNEADHIYVMDAATPSEAKARGREIRLRDGWGDNYGDLCWYVMVEALIDKFCCHEDLHQKLLATGERTLYEDSPVDDIWGWRYVYSYTGKNLLGKALMEVRYMIQAGALKPNPMKAWGADETVQTDRP